MDLCVIQRVWFSAGGTLLFPVHMCIERKDEGGGKHVTKCEASNVRYRKADVVFTNSCPLCRIFRIPSYLIAIPSLVQIIDYCISLKRKTGSLFK